MQLHINNDHHPILVDEKRISSENVPLTASLYPLAVVALITTVFQEERRIGEERAAELFRLTGVFTLRRTQEIINQYLSERIEWTVFCKPTELQLRLYGVLLATRPIRACLSGTSTHTYTHSPHLACINALKKLCNHPGLLYNTLQVQ